MLCSSVNFCGKNSNVLVGVLCFSHWPTCGKGNLQNSKQTSYNESEKSKFEEHRFRLSLWGPQLDLNWSIDQLKKCTLSGPNIRKVMEVAACQMRYRWKRLFNSGTKKNWFSKMQKIMPKLFGRSETNQQSESILLQQIEGRTSGIQNIQKAPRNDLRAEVGSESSALLASSLRGINIFKGFVA